MKKRMIRLMAAVLTLALCLSLAAPALAAREDYTMAGKLLKQLWAGSGFSGTLELALGQNEAAQGQALVTEKPFLVDWDYIYVRPTVAASAEHRLDASLMDGETVATQAHVQLKDGQLALQSPLLGEGWYSLSPDQLLSGSQTEGAQAVQDALDRTGMPALLAMMLPQVLRFQEQQSGLEAVLEQMTLRMDLWIEGYRQNAELGRLEDGSSTIQVNYAVSPANVKAQAKQMVLDVLSDDAMRQVLASCLDEETAALLLNPAYQPYYFAAIDVLPLSGDLTLSRTVDMQGETLALHLSLPFYDAKGGAVTLRYDREKGVGDLPDTNTLAMESEGRTMTLSYLTYRSMTDVTVYQGTFKVEDQSAGSFAVKPEGQETWQPEVAFTLSSQTAETKEDGDLNVYTVGWQLTLEPDPNGANPQAVLPLTAKLDGRFSSKTPQTAATKADVTLTLSGEERPQTVSLHFLGETRRQWTVEELPAQRTDLLSLSSEESESLLGTLLAQGGQVVSLFMSNLAPEATAEEAPAETAPAEAAPVEAAPEASAAPANE